MIGIKKSRVLKGVALLFAFCSLMASAKDYYVGGENASDDNAGTAAAPWATVFKAVSTLNQNQNAAKNNTIYVRKGTYVIDKSTYLNRSNLSLIGETGNPDDVILDCGGVTNALRYAAGITGETNRIFNLTIQHAASNTFAVAMKTRGLVVSNCVFRNNFRTALYAEGSAVITHCVFEGNGNTYRGSSTVDSCYGGACQIHGATTFRNCVFRDNKAAIGGAICAAGKSSNNLDISPPVQLRIEGCGFTNNFARAFGGAVYGVSTNGIVNSTFTGNVASNDFASGQQYFRETDYARGGAIVFAAGTNSRADGRQLVSNCTFTANVVHGEGASVIFGRNCNVDIFDSTFNCNTSLTSQAGSQFGTTMMFAAVYGNTVYVTQRVERCVFSGNVSESGQGCIYFSGALVGSSVRNCLFAGNRNNANPGGAIGTKVAIDVENCTFAGNHAVTYGGGIALLDTAAYASGVTNCLFVLNEASSPSTHAKGGVNVGWPDTSGSWTTRVAAFYNCMEVVTQEQYDTPGNGKSGTAAALSLGAGLTTCANKVRAGTPADFFVDAANGDYSPKKSTPARNAGVNAPWMAGATDLAGKARINVDDGNVVDIGCYEWYSSAPPGLMIFVR